MLAVASLMSTLSAVARAMFPTTSRSFSQVGSGDTLADDTPALPLELVDCLLALSIRLACPSHSSRSHHSRGAGASLRQSTSQVTAILHVVSQTYPGSLTLETALLHGLPHVSVGHLVRVIDQASDARDSSKRVLHALARPHIRCSLSKTKTLPPMNFHPSHFILPTPCSLLDQQLLADWWTAHLSLPTLSYLAPRLLASPHAAFLVRHLLGAHARAGTPPSGDDLDAALSLLSSLAHDQALLAWYRHEYAGPLKSADSATLVLRAPDPEALQLAHDLATPARVARHAVELACATGDVRALEYFAHLGVAIEPSRRGMDFASANGHVGVLDYWVAQGWPVKYSSDAVDKASARGHVGVLEWWWARRDTWAFEATEAAMDDAGDASVLEWWVHPARYAERRYTEAAVHSAACKCSLEMLAWWARSGLPVKCDAARLARELSSLRDARGVQVLEWWAAQPGLPNLTSAVDVRILEACATYEALMYWLPHVGGASCWVRAWTWPRLLFRVPAHEDPRVRVWWAHESHLAFGPSTDLLRDASVRGDLATLDWWAARGDVPAMRGQDVFAMMHAGQVGALDWWARQGEAKVFVQEYAVLVEAVRSLNPRVLAWVVQRYYRGSARMSTEWDDMVEAVDAFGAYTGAKATDGKQSGVGGYVGMANVRLVG